MGECVGWFTEETTFQLTASQEIIPPQVGVRSWLHTDTDTQKEVFLNGKWKNRQTQTKLNQQQTTFTPNIRAVSPLLTVLHISRLHEPQVRYGASVKSTNQKPLKKDPLNGRHLSVKDIWFFP